MDVVDLRSDTVTRPTAGMRRAIAEAEVGDDGYGEDPSVNALQREVAERFGYAAALFVPTGIMANQIALALLVRPGEELLAPSDTHVVTFEAGAAAVVGGMSARTWPANGGALDVGVIGEYVRPRGWPPTVPTAAISVENTHAMSGGTPLPIDQLRRLRELADATGVALHCDGARIWHAHVADGVPLAEYGAVFDVMSVGLSKGLGAPAGSLVLADAERIEAGREVRRRLGGAMGQAGILAAAGRYGLAHHLDRLADDHVRAARLAAALAPYGVVAEPARVRTNMVILDLRRHPMDMPALAAEAARHGVLVSVIGPRAGRLITHLDVDDPGIDRAVKVLTGLLG